MAQTSSKTSGQDSPNKLLRTEDGRPICFGCQRPGHIFRHCQFREKKDESSSSKKARLEIEPPPSSEKNPN